MDYKKNISAEDITQIAAWFNEHEGKLPESFQLDDATKILNLRKYIASLFEIYNLHKNPKAFNGQIFHLWIIKEKLEKEWGK